MSEEKIALLTELREVIKKEGKDDAVNQVSFRLQSLLEEELDVEPLSLPRFQILKENSQEITDSLTSQLGALSLEKKGKVHKIGILKMFPYPEIAILREIYLCFIPDELQEKMLFQKTIHYILLSELSSYEHIDDYNELFLTFLLEQKAEEPDQFNLKQFFSVKAKVRSFFHFLRRNYVFFKSIDAEELIKPEVVWDFFNKNKFFLSVITDRRE